MSRTTRRPRNFGDHPADQSPTVVTSEWSAEELAERYLAQCRARAMAARTQVEGKGDGDQAATPTRHPDEETDNQAPQRRKPGV